MKSRFGFEFCNQLGELGNVRLGSKLNPQYGVQWDTTVPSTILTKVGAASVHLAQPIYNKIRFACVNDDLSINYYLDPTNHNYKENGDPSNLTGADGQVIGIIPAFYVKFYSIGTQPYLLVSESPIAGYTYRFPKTGIGKYLGSIDSNGKLASVSGVMPVVNYACGFSAGSFGARARARGAGWNPVTEYKALQQQIIELIFTANFNAQSAISAGATNDDGAWQYRGYGGIKLNGLSNSYGDYTGSIPFVVNNWFIGATTGVAVNKVVSAGRFATAKGWKAGLIGLTIKNTTTNATAVITAKDSDGQLSIDADIFTATAQNFTILNSTFSTQDAVFAGFEDYFGQIYEWRAGALVNFSGIGGATPLAELYRCKDASKAADTITADYAKVGEMPTVAGFITSLIPGTIMPLTVGGSSVTYMADYYYPSTSNGVRIVLVGGYLNYGATAGPRLVYATYASGYAYANLGARLGLTFPD